MGELAEHCFRR